jgi:hypothetical protein
MSTEATVNFTNACINLCCILHFAFCHGILDKKNSPHAIY